MDAEKLIIYKASAGSGKTFQLTREYLTILFKNPGAYKNILAVTFTNKATAEMKGRILEELAKIANGDKSPYLIDIQNIVEISPDKIKERATTILHHILHDYSRFTVETIDNFFQRVLKSFTKELHIYFNYNLELDTSKIIDLATSRLIFNSHENSDVRKWLTDFALEKIADGRTWNAKKDIISLGYELFNEQFQLLFDNVKAGNNSKEVLGKYIVDCYKVINAFEEHLSALGKEAVRIIEENGLSVDDFTQKKRGVAAYFYKLAEKKDSAPNRYVLNASDDFENWIPKKSKQRDLIEQLYHQSLGSLLDSILKYRDENYEQYASAREILKLTYAFGILTDLYTRVREITNEQNIFLLADTGKLIHSIIENNDAPFIYEKLGNIYSHYMIDEFQDTSELQWKNFFPLIQNSLALGKKNIVVGDVKQAIYRWRNSNWNILGSKIYQQIPGGQLQAVNLDKNWRSLKNILYFNNSLYRSVSSNLQYYFNKEADEFLLENPYSNTINTAYNELMQELPDKNGEDEGTVNIKFINDESWEEQILVELPGVIIDFLKKGYEQSQIAILVRNKKEGQLIIDKLLDCSQMIEQETGIMPNFLSSDALLLSSSKSVRFILGMLNYIITPDDKVNEAFLVKLAGEFGGENLLFHNNLENKSNTISEKINSEISEISQGSLFELVSKIIKTFNLEKLKEKAFLAAFLDTVLDFSRNHHVGIKSFLDWWDEKGETLSLNLEEAENAIQVLTIHKSKGLEFDAVIIPFCNWRIDQHVSHANIMWCKPTTEPFNTLPVVPLKYSQKLGETFFKKEYAFEKLNTFIDNMNLLYVATTRAKKALFIRSPHPEQIKRRGLTSSTLLLNAFENENAFRGKNELDLPGYYSKEDFLLNIGTFAHQEKTKKVQQGKIDVVFSGSSFDISEKLRVKYNHKEFFSTQIQARLLDNGKLLHKIFEHIKYAGDVNRAVEKVCLEGLVAFEEKSFFVDSITKLIGGENVKDWFDKKWQVKTEAEILLPGIEQKRPDRILIGEGGVKVIDYKFGLSENNKHAQQVEEYMDLLKEMGYSFVEGYVWYVALNKITKV